MLWEAEPGNKFERVVPHLPRTDVSTSGILVFRATEILAILELRTTCRGGGMADAADLKSVVRKDVRVRLPPSAPQENKTYGQPLSECERPFLLLACLKSKFRRGGGPLNRYEMG